MKLENFVRKYNGYVIEDAGAYASEDFKKFARTFRGILKAEMESIGAELVSYSIGHYFVSVFVKKSEKYIYISYDCPRYGQAIDFSRNGVADGILYRKAKDTKDFRGEKNHFCSMSKLTESINGLFNAPVMR